VKIYYVHAPLAAEEIKQSGKVTAGRVWTKCGDREREISKNRIGFAVLYLAPKTSKEKDLLCVCA